MQKNTKARTRNAKPPRFDDDTGYLKSVELTLAEWSTADDKEAFADLAVAEIASRKTPHPPRG